MDIRSILKQIKTFVSRRILLVSTLMASVLLVVSAAVIFSPLLGEPADVPPQTSMTTPAPAVNPSPIALADPSPTPSAAPSTSPVEAPLDLAALARKYAKENGDVVGWVRIEGTLVDYPVLHTTDNTYYMDHNMQKEKDKKGAIFLDYRCDPVMMGGNNILYGHHMRDGSMFAGLMAYRDEAFYETHPTIEYATLDGSTEWEIFSVFITGTDYDYIRTEFGNGREYSDFLRIMEGKSLYDTGITTRESDDILILSTCTYEFDDARFAVAARRKQ